MVSIVFKNVGQGDSIFLEWDRDGKMQYAIIDCNLFENFNPLLQEIKQREITSIELIVLSHLHSDHYSGFSELLNYCIDNSIRINWFLFTFTSDLLHVFNRITLSQRIQKTLDQFIIILEKAFNERIIIELEDITHNFPKFNLYDSVELYFLAPNRNDYFQFAKQRSKNVTTNITTKPDINSLSTIIKISDKKQCVILTSDAVINSFKRIRNLIQEKTILIQVPHHGSKENFDDEFWLLLNKSKLCPAVFSVGDVLKDKLPDKEVVEFFDKNGYYINSTNFVNGLAEYYGNLSENVITRSTFLNAFSRRIVKTNMENISDRFIGDQQFSVFK